MTDLALEATGLTKIFAGGDGVRDVDLTVARGEIHAIVGLNGAGKSTLMRLLLGMIRPDRGETLLNGQAISAAGPELWARVGHLVEYPLAYPELTVVENLRLAARLHDLTAEQSRELVERSVSEFKLEHYADRAARKLSLGNRQRVGLAAALQHDPAIVVLDEPTNALDPAGVILLREIVLRHARENGAAVLVSSHHLDEVARIAERITVMNNGRMIGTLDPTTVDIERAFFSLVHEDSQNADTENAA